MGSLSMLGQKGDTKVSWDPSNTGEVALAKKVFDEGKAKGFAAYKTKGGEWRKGEQIKTFDPEAERIILIPPMAGG